MPECHGPLPRRPCAACSLACDSSPPIALPRSWYPKLFDETRHAWGYDQALTAGKWCRNNDLRLPALEASCGAEGCGRCIGPFVFASGFLMVLSQPLLTAITSHDALAADAEALRAINVATIKGALPPLRTHRTRAARLCWGRRNGRARVRAAAAVVRHPPTHCHPPTAPISISIVGH